MVSDNASIQRIFHQYYTKWYKGEEISPVEVGGIFKETKLTKGNG